MFTVSNICHCMVFVCVAMEGPWVILPSLYYTLFLSLYYTLFLSLCYTLFLAFVDEVISWLNGWSGHDFRGKSTSDSFVSLLIVKARSFTFLRFASKLTSPNLQTKIGNRANWRRHWQLYYYWHNSIAGAGLNFTWLLLPRISILVHSDFSGCGILKMSMINT